MRSGADRPAISTGPALMIPAGYPRDLPSALLRAARDFAGAGVVEIGPDGRETKLDFPTLLELAARILAGLRANGVRAGDPAVVHCTEPVGFFAAFWACTLGGIRPLLVAPNPGGDRTEEGRERLRRITDLLGWTVLIGRPSDLPNDLGLPVLDPDALAGHEPTSDFHRPAADDVAVLMLSSGSTGAPKMVQLTHRGLVEFAAGTPAMLPVRPGQTTLNWLPLDRSGAFLLYHLLPVFTGCTNIHVNTGWVLANPLRWFDLMEQHRVNHSWSPNFGYRLATAAVAGEPDRHWDLSALRSLVSGGEQITVPVMSEFLRVTNRFGVVPETFVAAWGMTETVTGITFARPGLTPNVHRVRIPPTGVVEWVDQRPSSGKVAVARPGAPRVEAPGVLSLVSVGAPAPGTTVRIVAPNGAVLPEGRIGQLQVASARVTPGYLGNLEADRVAFPVGNWPARKWLATGDQGFITGGQVVVTGRDSERIIMSGKLHYAHDIESVAATVVGASSGLVAACGIADEETGTDRLVVFYALTPDSVPGMDQAIRSLIQTRLGLAAQVVGVPRRDFPTTPGGKILRPLLKQRWIDGTLDPASHPHVEPAGATQSSGPTGQGPSTTPELTPYADEDPSERTTELPVVHLAWKRELQQSIPTPPERPTLGTTTPPIPTPDPTAPYTPSPNPTQPEPSRAQPDLSAQPESAPAPGDLSVEPEPSRVQPDVSAEPVPAPAPAPEDLSVEPEPSRAQPDVSAEPESAPAPEDLSVEPEPSRAQPDVSADPVPAPAPEDLSAQREPSRADDHLPAKPETAPAREGLSAEPETSPAQPDLSAEPEPAPATEDLSAQPETSRADGHLPAEPQTATATPPSPTTPPELSEPPAAPAASTAYAPTSNDLPADLAPTTPEQSAEPAPSSAQTQPAPHPAAPPSAYGPIPVSRPADGTTPATPVPAPSPTDEEPPTTQLPRITAASPAPDAPTTPANAKDETDTPRPDNASTPEDDPAADAPTGTPAPTAAEPAARDDASTPNAEPPADDVPNATAVTADAVTADAAAAHRGDASTSDAERPAADVPNAQAITADAEVARRGDVSTDSGTSEVEPAAADGPNVAAASVDAEAARRGDASTSDAGPPAADVPNAQAVTADVEVASRGDESMDPGRSELEPAAVDVPNVAAAAANAEAARRGDASTYDDERPAADVPNALAVTADAEVARRGDVSVDASPSEVEPAAADVLNSAGVAADAADVPEGPARAHADSAQAGTDVDRAVEAAEASAGDGESAEANAGAASATNDEGESADHGATSEVLSVNSDEEPSDASDEHPEAADTDLTDEVQTDSEQSTSERTDEDDLNAEPNAPAADDSNENGADDEYEARDGVHEARDGVHEARDGEHDTDDAGKHDTDDAGKHDTDDAGKHDTDDVETAATECPQSAAEPEAAIIQSERSDDDQSDDNRSDDNRSDDGRSDDEHAPASTVAARLDEASSVPADESADAEHAALTKPEAGVDEPNSPASSTETLSATEVARAVADGNSLTVADGNGVDVARAEAVGGAEGEAQQAGVDEGGSAVAQSRTVTQSRTGADGVRDQYEGVGEDRSADAGVETVVVVGEGEAPQAGADGGGLVGGQSQTVMGTAGDQYAGGSDGAGAETVVDGAEGEGRREVGTGADGSVAGPGIDAGGVVAGGEAVGEEISGGADGEMAVGADEAAVGGGVVTEPAAGEQGAAGVGAEDASVAEPDVLAETDVLAGLGEGAAVLRDEAGVGADGAVATSETDEGAVLELAAGMQSHNEAAVDSEAGGEHAEQPRSGDGESGESDVRAADAAVEDEADADRAGARLADGDVVGTSATAVDASEVEPGVASADTAPEAPDATGEDVDAGETTLAAESQTVAATSEVECTDEPKAGLETQDAAANAEDLATAKDAAIAVDAHAADGADADGGAALAEAVSAEGVDAAGEAVSTEGADAAGEAVTAGDVDDDDGAVRAVDVHAGDGAGTGGDAGAGEGAPVAEGAADVEDAAIADGVDAVGGVAAVGSAAAVGDVATADGADAVEGAAAVDGAAAAAVDSAAAAAAAAAAAVAGGLAVAGAAAGAAVGGGVGGAERVAAVEVAGRGGEASARVVAGVVEPVAVVGVAGRFPGAETLEGFWENLVGGVESVRRGRPDVGDGVVAVSGVLEHVEAFDAKFFGLSDREAELMEPAQRLFLEVCHQALEHGGYAGTSDRVGVFAGSGMNLYNRQHQSRDSIATRVAYRLGLTGPAIGVQSASSSSLVAVHLACQALRSGDADLALAGAAAVQVPQATTYHPTPDSILSPSGHVRAFAADADGTVGGNGVAAVLLKRLDQALTDGDTVYAVIRGTAVSNADGNQVELVERALQRAGFDADSLSYIEANGIGAAAADAAEVKALTTALRRHTDKVGFCTLGSVKPNIGHLDSAAGMAGLIKTILMLQHRTLVPTINFTKPNPELALDGSPFVIGTDAREWTVPLQSGGTTLRAGVSALDPSGTNAHVILEEAPRQIRRGDDGPVVLPLSAPDPDALADLVELYRSDLGHGTGHRLIDLAGTAALGRPAHRYRIAVAGASELELVSALGSAQPTEVPRGGPGPLGYAFTGQGAARRGMAAGLAARFPVFRSVLDECDRVYHEETGGSLNELLLTPAGGAEGVWPTETAQPALFAFEVALARLWQSFGVQPALVVGHSVGEYAALCVAGALSVADGVRLTAKRGELMQRGTVPGAMVAVRADADRVREIARSAGVEVAAGNGPQSFVLTGSEVIVGQLAAQLDQLQVAWQRLDVDRAFHSSLVDPILSDFAEIVREITLKPLRTPMVSSWSGDLLESGTVLDSDYLVGQLRQPVLFGDAVEAVTAAGCRRFLELGPDAVLSPAGRRIAPNSTWIPAQRLGQDPVLATMNGLAELYEQGTEIAWAKVYADGGRVPLPTYPFRRVHHPVDPSVTVLAGPGTAVAGDNNAPRLNAFERAARAQSVVFEPPSSAAVKRIPLDPPVTPEPVEPESDEAERDEPDAFALPAETHAIDADYLAQAGSLSGNEMSAERYRESLDVVLDLTCEVHNLDPYDLTVDHTFAELGATPASMAPVLDELNSRFEAGLAPDDLFLTYTTPHKLATAVAVQTAEPEPTDPEPTEAAPPGTQASGPGTTGTGTNGTGTSGTGASGTGASGTGASGAGGSLIDGAEVGVADEAGSVARDPRAALAVLGSGLAELAAKVDEAAAATSEAELPGSGMAALMSQQLRVAGQLVDGVTKLMREQLALLTDTTDTEDDAAEPNDLQVRVLESTCWDDLPEVAPKPDDMRRDLAYWEQVLAGAEPLVLPADRVRGAGDDAVASVERKLDEELADAVFAYSRDRKLSPVMTMLAATATVLGRFAAQEDVTIGSALIRPKGETEPRPALPLRIDLSGEPELGELTERIRDITTAASDHAGADLGFFERDPLFQILVDFEDGDEELPPSVDLRFRLTHQGAGIACRADYRTGLFDRRTVERLLGYLAEVLRRATTNPQLRLPELVLPVESDLELLRELESDADPVGPIGRVRRDAVVAGELSGLHTLFEQQVARTPDAIAVLQGDRELTYAELDRRSNAVAWQLADLGVKPGEIVAVRVARGTEMVVAVLAVLKSGAAYLPLDPGVPESRWAFMVHDAAAVALVGDDAALADRLGLRLVPVVAADGDARARQAPPVRAAADDVAYCIYTSGSSGNPKGVVVPHRGPVNLVRHYLRTRRSLRTLQWTSFGFDVHVQEMFTTLASGAALVLIGEDDRYDPDAVVAALRDHGVQRLFMAFSPLTALLATMRRLPELPALREIVAGGEAMVLTHKVREFLDAHPQCRLFNEYGPTEASIVTTIHEVDPAEDRPSIGRPIEGVAVRLLDAALRPVPVGAVGEIHLGGAAVAQGYLGRPEETEHAFVGDPGHPGARLYRSRDLGRWRVDGTLEYLGRADDQVKIRGHRVEPGETEHVLADQPGVVDAVVVAQADPAGDTCLIGYVVLEDSDPAVLARLMLDLGKELPIYLVPADLIPIEELPLDDNGRLDRARLPEPEWLRP